MELEQLNNIRWSQHDKANDLLLVWYGGYGIHAYDNKGMERLFWNMEGTEEPTLADVQSNIEEHIKQQDYFGYY